MRMRQSGVFVCVMSLLLIAAAVRSEATTAPRTFTQDAAALAEQRHKVLANPAEFEPALAALRRAAEDAMRQGPWSVTDKTQVPPSDDKHDYMSVGPYWWPDPSSPDGLPYIRRDGETSPERYDYDNVRLKSMVYAVEALAVDLHARLTRFLQSGNDPHQSKRIATISKV